MAFVTEQILAETDTTLTIKFTSRNGNELIKVVTKIAGKTNEQMLAIWHTKMVLLYLEYAIKKNRFKRTIVEEGTDSIVLRLDKRAA
jgi:hypothetical protein